MESNTAIRGFSALAHDARLELVRLLVRAGPNGLGAGELAARLGQAPSTSSAQLLVLSNAGLVCSERRGREVRYFAAFDMLRALTDFMGRDCCAEVGGCR